MNDITAQFVDDRQLRRLKRRFGGHVADWLSELPAVVDKLAAEWRLTVDGPATHGRTSVVLYTTLADGRKGVLKLTPDSGLAVSEAAMLRMWRPTGRVPRVWAVDSGHGAILMERIERDTTLAETGIVPPMATIGTLISQLHGVDVPRRRLMELRPLMARVQFVFDLWSRERNEGPAVDIVSPTAMHQGYNRARALAVGEIDLAPLHGDLHPGNVLDGGPRGLVAVDPRACYGDGAVDAVDWAVWKAASVTEVERRVDVLSRTMGVDGQRMMEWVRAFAPCMAVAMVNRAQGHTDQFATLMELMEDTLINGRAQAR
ncbi:aminoglycoside phosphotransferase family protein [Nocardiopsis sp. CNT312]|uniref:aminoglycoside phosphotransferase family protein n=1 Tax=Nocardiopsis sp. CNT312 TaxID=1137268 RepID=UPI00048AC937|nr:aminoglycoside phosphotransferase family protein [Nocardiopsis sp. CNT312]